MRKIRRKDNTTPMTFVTPTCTRRETGFACGATDGFVLRFDRVAPDAEGREVRWIVRPSLEECNTMIYMKRRRQNVMTCRASPRLRCRDLFLQRFGHRSFHSQMTRR